MKVVLATGLIPKKEWIGFGKSFYYPPLGLGYLAAALENKGHKVYILDCLFSQFSVKEAVDCILKQKPDIIGMSVMSTSFAGAKSIVELIKKKTNIPIVLGGPQCSSFPARTMEECPGADFLIYGEGEYILPVLVEALSKNLPYSDIPQLCFRDSSGKIVVNKQELFTEDLNIIPYPARHLFNKKLYNTHTILTSRGCSYGQCLFCARTGLLYERYRRRSIENVIKELEIMFERFSVEDVMFVDDNFAQDELWVIDFCDRLIRKRINLKWRCNARVDTITEAMVRKMADAGCYMIMYGLESGSQFILDSIKKGITIAEIKKAVNITNKAGIKTMGYFMFGLPDETPELGSQTIDFAKELDLYMAQFVPARIIYGTKLYDLCKSKGRALYDYNDFYDTKAAGPFLVPKIKFVPEAYKTEENLAKTIKLAYKSFYFRLSYIKKLLSYKKVPYRLNKLPDLVFLFYKIFFLKFN